MTDCLVLNGALAPPITAARLFAVTYIVDGVTIDVERNNNEKEKEKTVHICSFVMWRDGFRVRIMIRYGSLGMFWRPVDEQLSFKRFCALQRIYIHIHIHINFNILLVRLYIFFIHWLMSRIFCRQKKFWVTAWYNK